MSLQVIQGLICNLFVLIRIHLIRVYAAREICEGMDPPFRTHGYPSAWGKAAGGKREVHEDTYGFDFTSISGKLGLGGECV